MLSIHLPLSLYISLVHLTPYRYLSLDGHSNTHLSISHLLISPSPTIYHMTLSHYLYLIPLALYLTRSLCNNLSLSLSQYLYLVPLPLYLTCSSSTISHLSLFHYISLVPLPLFLTCTSPTLFPMTICPLFNSFGTLKIRPATPIWPSYNIEYIGSLFLYDMTGVAINSY